MDKKFLNELRTVNTERFSWALGNALRAYAGGADLICATMATAYVKHKASQDPHVKTDSVDNYLRTSKTNDLIGLFIKDNLRDAWSEAMQAAFPFEDSVFLAYVIFADDHISRTAADTTPVGLAKLAERILDIQANDLVADYGTGRASFIRECFIDNPDAHYFGNDINSASVCMALMRAEFLGGDITIVQENLFHMELQRFDKLFSNYPFAVRLRDWDRECTASTVMQHYPPYSKSVSSDWVFNALLVESMTENGKAVGIMSNGSTWNTLDKYMRRDFLERGYIETVIALPEKLFDNTSIPTCLIVFSHGNRGVKFVDARNVCEKGRRNNIITDVNIAEIVGCLEKTSEICVYKTCAEIAENDYVINPTRYMAPDVAIENGIPFGSVITNITRGAQLSASQLDELVSREPTEYQYLMLKNIQNGIIDDELPYLKSLESRLERYCLKNKTLIISKNGYPFKVAVATIEERKQVLANGNLYVIELDESKADPYFIKAFFESEKGIAALSSIAVGAAIPNISVEQLRHIQIPATPIEKQHDIAQQYLARLDEIAVYKMKIEKAKDSLKHIIDFSEEV